MEHSDPHDATSRAMAEVTSAVIATSLVLICRLCAGLVLPGHDRHSLPAVLADDCILDCDFRVQRAHALSGAFGAVSCAAKRQDSPSWTSCTSGFVSRAFRRLRRVIDGSYHAQLPAHMRGHPLHPCTEIRHAGAVLCWTRWCRLYVPARADGIHSAGGPGLPDGRDPGSAGIFAGLHDALADQRIARPQANRNIEARFRSSASALPGTPPMRNRCLSALAPPATASRQGHSAADIVADLARN